MNQDNITNITTYLRQFGPLLAERILETYPPMQSTKDPVAPRIATLLRKALPAQALAITGTAKYLRRAKAARIVAECGAGKTYMALGTIHVLADGRPSTTLVMCPSHITHKWAREVLLTIPCARAFLIEDMRNGGDPSRPHGICEVKLSKGKTFYEGKRLSLAEMRRMGRKEWRKRFPGPTFFITGKDKGKLGYFWEHVYLKAKSGPNLGGVVNPDSGVAILDSEMQKLTALDFTDKLKVSEALTAPRGGTTRYSALWQADRSRIQRMAPIEYVGRYMRGWFDFAIADELHQLAGDTAQGNGLGVLGRAAQEIDRAYWNADGRLRRRPVQHLLSDGASRHGARGLRLRRTRPAGLPGAVRRSRNDREGGRGGQRLLKGNEEDGPGSAQTRSLADALRQVPDDHDCVSLA
jgi:hypothetical protein